MAVVACLMTLAGCNSDEVPPSASPTGTSLSSSSESATPTSTPSRSLTPDQQDLRSAEDAIAEYWWVLDGAASNPNQSLNILATVARSQALAQWQTTLTTDRAQGLTQKGLSTVRDVEASSKDGKTFTVSACLDVSAVDVVDASGKSMVRSDRPALQNYTYMVQKAPEGFFVIQDLLKGQPCAG
ncbi:hypothetical protein V6K52_03295 [Knoellia sp. S7-12]|uniref:hypothetical protein n=1 Tax=Knoellia sp. S7-12 TaxID=3126698 RepID=UPI003366241A